MSKKLLSVTVKGREHLWGFNFYGDPKYIPEWVADGLEITALENVVPLWIVTAKLVKPWCFLQDVFNFKNPFKKSRKQV